jgi:hypothetical protein
MFSHGELCAVADQVRPILSPLCTLPHDNPNPNTYARTLTNQHGSHWQHRRNDATELAHADMTALPKTDTKYTARL